MIVCLISRNILHDVGLKFEEVYLHGYHSDGGKGKLSKYTNKLAPFLRLPCNTRRDLEFCLRCCKQRCAEQRETSATRARPREQDVRIAMSNLFQNWRQRSSRPRRSPTTPTSPSYPPSQQALVGGPSTYPRYISLSLTTPFD